jgi:hypothetical protein
VARVALDGIGWDKFKSRVAQPFANGSSAFRLSRSKFGNQPAPGGNDMTARILRRFLAIAVFAIIMAPLGARAQSCLITKAIVLAPLTLASGKPLAEAPYELESGKYYRLAIKADGSAELAVVAPEFFRNIWINEVVINDIEVRPLGLDSLEFDGEGEATISFIPIRPGKFVMRIPGTSSESQSAVFNVK